MMHSAFPLQSKTVAFCGKLGGVSQREANRLVKNCGGTPAEMDHPEVNLVVLGAEELPLAQKKELLNEGLRSRVRSGALEVISETQLWERLGFVDQESEYQRLYTPAMVADLLDVPVACIRKWHRHGLIRPLREFHRLPYFDFQEVNTARRLAELVEGGASPSQIKKNLEQLSEYLPEIERPLAQLSVIIEGKRVLLRQDEGVVEPNGQIRFDFEGVDSTVETGEEFDEEVSLTFPLGITDENPDVDYSGWSFEDLVDTACQLEDDGNLPQAIEVYRSLLISHGPRAEINFQLAELLYRSGEIEAARERYYATIELDEAFVEARANLGCVLTELGHDELAVSAFQGALEFHTQFPDVHFHLARTLDRLKRGEEAEHHWREFLKMYPESSWAAEARERLKIRPVSDDDWTTG
ncbi:MAG: MerR family transcriptional regulator [Planctomycetota bacterium]|nr:MerR family transcriptional regulator [Planctomycetota bacterium]